MGSKYNLSDSSISNPFASPSQSTTYALLISNGRQILNPTINIIDPSISLPSVYTLCNYDDIITLTPSNGNNSNLYIWSTNSQFDDTLNILTDSTIAVSPNNDTWYFVKSINGSCEFIDSTLVQVSIGNLSLIGDSILCFGDSILIVAETFRQIPLILFLA